MNDKKTTIEMLAEMGAKHSVTVRQWEDEFNEEFMEYAAENENTLIDVNTDGNKIKSFIRTLITQAKQEQFEKDCAEDKEWDKEREEDIRKEAYARGKKDAEDTRAEWDRRRLDILEMTREEARSKMAREVMEKIEEHALAVKKSDKTPKYEYSRKLCDANRDGEFPDGVGQRWAMPRELADNLVSQFRNLLEPYLKEDGKI